MDGKKTGESAKRQQAVKDRVREDMRTAGLVRDEMARVSFMISDVNQTVNTLMRHLDRFSSDIAKKGKELDSYPTLNARIVASRRLIMATKLGLERNLLRHYEADISETVRRSVNAAKETDK